MSITLAAEWRSVCSPACGRPAFVAATRRARKALRGSQGSPIGDLGGRQVGRLLGRDPGRARGVRGLTASFSEWRGRSRRGSQTTPHRSALFDVVHTPRGHDGRRDRTDPRSLTADVRRRVVGAHLRLLRRLRRGEWLGSAPGVGKRPGGRAGGFAVLVLVLRRLVRRWHAGQSGPGTMEPGQPSSCCPAGSRSLPSCSRWCWVAATAHSPADAGAAGWRPALAAIREARLAGLVGGDTPLPHALRDALHHVTGPMVGEANALPHRAGGRHGRLPARRVVARRAQASARRSRSLFSRYHWRVSRARAIAPWAQ